MDQAVSFSGKGVDYFAKVKCEYLLDAASRVCGDPAGLKMLDVGCGVGVTDRYLAGRVGELYGTDVAGDTVAQARETNPDVHYSVSEAGRLPFEDGMLDVSFAFCVFHHVLPGERAQLAEEMVRVTRPGGIVAIFEHNPWNLLTRLVVSRCSFDADAILLRAAESKAILRAAELASVRVRHLLLTPWELPLLARLERALGFLPLGAQYAAIGRRRA